MTAVRKPVASDAELDARVREACAKADQLVGPLLTSSSGPTMALLVLYVARAEVLRVARERVAPAEWDRFLAQQEKLERVFDDRCEVIRKMNRELIVLSGNFVGDFRG